MRTLIAAALLALALAAPAADARSRPKPEPLSMKDARSVALLQATDLAEAMNESATPIAHSSGLGRCERLSNSRARCRVVAHGTYETCRGWSYSRSAEDDPNMVYGWLRDLRCKPVSK